MMSDIELLNESEENLEWFQSNFSEIGKKFLNRFIAIKDKEIVADSDNLDNLLKLLKERKIDDSETLIEAITSKKSIVVL